MGCGNTLAGGRDAKTAVSEHTPNCCACVWVCAHGVCECPCVLLLYVGRDGWSFFLGVGRKYTTVVTQGLWLCGEFSTWGLRYGFSGNPQIRVDAQQSELSGSH